MQFACPDVRRTSIVSTLWNAVGDEVLQRGEGGIGPGEVAPTLTAYDGCCHLAAEHWVFAKRLFHSRPPRLPREVDDRTITHMSALQAYLTGNGVSHSCHECGIEGGRQSQSCGKHSGANGHVSVRRFFGEEEGDAQTGVLYGIALHGIRRLGGTFGIEAVGDGLLCPWVGTEGAPVTAYEVLVYLVAELCRHLHLLAIGGVGVPTEHTEHLSHFLLQGHA